MTVLPNEEENFELQRRAIERYYGLDLAKKGFDQTACLLVIDGNYHEIPIVVAEYLVKCGKEIEELRERLKRTEEANLGLRGELKNVREMWREAIDENKKLKPQQRSDLPG